MALYSILRAGVRFFGFALPGSCVDTAVNLSFSSGSCIPSTTWLDTRISFATSAHAWSWVMYGSFALLIAVYPWNGTFRGWLAFMVTGFTIAAHELIWFSVYFGACSVRPRRLSGIDQQYCHKHNDSIS